jgi:hypothetical protein
LPAKDGPEVLIEIVRQGAYAKASAIDPVTRTEVSVVGPSASDDEALKAAAVKKLAFVLKRRQKPD